MRIGQLIAGRYRLEERIGSGGNGVVWRATDEELGRVIAVKRALSGGAERAAERIALLRREARILARVNHPNVVTLFDLVADGGEWWLAMEYVPASSLAGQGTLPPGRVAGIGVQLARALQAVHAAGVLHRDVKPANVFLVDDQHAKLGDFGISRVVEGDMTLTDTGRILGTPGFIAPEVAGGEDPSEASDVFSLGATLFAAVEGTTPCGPPGNPLLLLRRAAQGDIARSRRGGALAPVLSVLLNVDPAKRPTAAQAEQMLQDVAVAPAADGDTDGPRRGSRRRIAVAAGTIVIALAVSGWLLAAVLPGAPPAPARDLARPRPVPAVGDPRTADPCALTDPAALARFGEARQETHFGNFNRCDVIVRADGDSEVDVKVELYGESAPEGVLEKAGALGIVRQPADGSTCGRSVHLPDRHRVQIDARQTGDGEADLCAIAEAATTSAVAVLSRGEIPRRRTPAEPASLINVDACALLGPGALARFPGVDPLRSEAGFAGWWCRWHSTASRSSLLVRFDRNQPLTSADGRPIRLGDRAAFVESEGYGEETCQVQVVHRPTTDSRGEPVAELLLVVVSGPGSAARRCELATDLARPAAAGLPPPPAGSVTGPERGGPSPSAG
ncbi:serine/threonine-protein kinase [Streptosporangium sp. KLBMP 9127]|nr:serine/threonine protein kinase [Streptosporangium sp. KLBMP 9127]MCG5220798.1 serine/threonine protein kinase [Streptosporangium sp. KLBMP 9127]